MGSDPASHGDLSASPWAIGAGRALEGSAGYLLRDGRREDLDVLMRIETRAHQAPWTTEVFRRELEVEWSHTWLLVEAAEPSSAVALLVFWVVYDEVHILDVAVDPEHRRRGLARKMIDALIEIASEQAMALMTLEVRVSNIAAQKLYEDLRFERLGRRPRYYQDNDEDAFVMSRSIEES